LHLKDTSWGDEKDNEDALHVEELFKENIDYEKIKKLKALIKLRQDEIRRSQEKQIKRIEGILLNTGQTILKLIQIRSGVPSKEN